MITRNNVVPFAIMAIVGILFWIGVGILAVKVAHADHLMCGEPPARTLTVHIEPGIDYSVALSSLDRWNEASGWVSGRAIFGLWNGSGTPDVTIRANAQTWVWYGCHGNSVVYWDNNPYWILHELGHALGFADHIRPTTNPAGYINPGTQNGYDGVMNYTSDPNVITTADLEMLWQWWF